MSGAPVEAVAVDRVTQELRSEVAAVYGAAHAAADGVVREFWERLPHHAERNGFRFRGAFDDDGKLCGFVYGYTGAHGQWWHDRVAFAMTEEQRRHWLEPAHFEVVELAVHPARQGNGVGTVLLEDVLAGLPHERAVLSARRDDERAVGFYRSRGWQTVIDSLRFSAGRPPFVVLGRELS